MTLTRKELIERLTGGEKLTCDGGKTYCYYDDNNSNNPFRSKIADNNNSWPMDSNWSKIEWEPYIEPFKWWEPKDGEKIYIIGSNELVTKSTVYNNELKKSKVYQGNVFRTREEARKEIEWHKARYTLKKAISKLNNEYWKPDWNDSTLSKYYIFFYYLNKEFVVTESVTIKHCQDWFYLKSKKLAEQLIETHSDDLLVYLEIEND